MRQLIDKPHLICLNPNLSVCYYYYIINVILIIVIIKVITVMIVMRITNSEN